MLVPERVADKGYWSDDDVRVKLKAQRKVVLRTRVAEIQTEAIEDVVSAIV